MEQTRGITIPLDQIDYPANADRIELDPDDITDRARSIREVGQLTDILVRPSGARYELIAGRCRCEALKLLGRTTARATVVTADDPQARILRAVENLQRSNLNPLEEAMACRDLRDQFGLNANEIADRLSKSKEWARIRLAMLDWPPDILVHVRRQTLSLGAAGHLAAIDDDLERARLTQYAVENGATARTCMAWRASWEANRESLTTEALAQRPTTPDYQTTELLMPCWACNTPVRLAELQLLRVCRDCTITLAEAIKLAHVPPGY